MKQAPPPADMSEQEDILNCLTEDTTSESTVSVDGEVQETQLEFFKAKVERLKSEIKDIEQDRPERKRFSNYIFVFMCAYVLAAIVMVILSGCGVLTLSDTVLVTLLTTALADVIGVFTFVAKYLFHRR